MNENDLLLFIHGLGCNADSWAGLAPYKDQISCPVLAPNLPGFGNTPAPDGFSFSMEAQADWLADHLRTRSFKRLHIVAHSMGGAVGLLLPDLFLHRTENFVSVEGNLIGEDCGLVSREAAATPLDQFKNKDFPQLLERWSRLRIQGVALEQTTAEVFHASSRSLVAVSESGKLKRRFLHLPRRKAYFYGGKNEHLPVLRKLPKELLYRIPDCGHFVMQDNPKTFYRTLIDWLSA